MSFRILGTGHYVPKRIVKNDELKTFVDTSDEWISRRVGVKERRVCTNETAVDLACEAARQAMEDADVAPEELDMILCATVSGDDASPSMACMVQGILGAGCPAMDINAACSGFIYMLDTAAGFFERKRVKKMLVVGAERMSRLIDWTDRGTCVIFGDGAGAAVLGEGGSYIASKLCAKGGDNVIKIPNMIGKSPFYEREQQKPYVHMNGQETFKFAVNSMCADVTDVIREAGLTESQIAWVLPHQANFRIVEAASKRLNIPEDRYCMNIDRYGNTSAASIPILLDEMNRQGRFRDGDYIVLCSFGGGLSSAACVLKWKA